MKKCIYIFIVLIAFCITQKGYGQLPTVYFNKVYRGDNSASQTYSSTAAPTSATILSNVQNVRFIGDSKNASGQFVATGNNINGKLRYITVAGNDTTIAGSITGKGGSGSNVEFYYFYVNSSNGYFLVNPTYESTYTFTSKNSSQFWNTSQNSPLADLNAFLAAQPIITVSASLSNFTACLNTASSTQTFTISGSGLVTDATGKITINAPSNGYFEIYNPSTSTYGSSLVLNNNSTSTIASTTITIRLKSNAAAGSYSGNFEASSANAGIQYVYVTGSVYATPAISSQPVASTVCSGNATSFSVTASGSNLTYKWQFLAPGGSWTDLTNTGIYSGATTSVLRLSSSLTNTYNGYQYRCLISGSCTAGLTSSEVTLTVNSAPAISSQPSNSTVCSGNATSFSVTATGTNLTYQWQKKIVGGASFTNISNGGIYSNATTSTLNISSGVTTSEDGVQYQCIVSGTCSPSVTSNAATITVNAVPATPASISGLSNICMSTLQTYSVVHNNAATTYTWTVPGNWTGSSTEDFINITSGNVSETVNIKVKAGNACGYSSEVSLSVSVNSNPAPIISFTKNAASQCLSGNSFTFTSSVTTVSGVTASSYSWDYGDGSTLGTGANGSRTYTSANSYDVKLTVTASNNCVTSYVSAVTVNPAPTSSLTGTTSICNGNSATLSTTLTGTSPWSLTYSDGTNSTTLSGITNANYTFNVSPTSNKTYTITSLTDNNCSTALAANLSGSAAITVNSNVNASVSITSSDADNTFCSGASVTFTASPTNGGSPTYAWMKNGVAISGATSSTYASSGIADYDVISVQMTASSQTCLVNNTVYSNEITNRVAPGAPRTPALINGQTTQCASVGGQVYSIAEVLNATSYTWTYPTGWTLTSGSGTSSATFTVGTTSQTGDITVTASNGCGTSTAQTLTIGTINAAPTISSTTAGSRCDAGTVTLGAASSGTLNWYAASTGGSSLGSSSSYTTPSISVTTTYYVDATSGSCTTAPRTAVIATVNTKPTISTTSPASNCGTGTVTLGATASAGTVNWYTASSGGSSVSTGTSYTTPSISSTTTYYVDATNNGCTTASRTAIAATINAIPTIASNTPGSRCGTGTVALGATASAGTVNWYTASSGGSSVSTGTSYTTPSISSTTNYYVDATNNGCTTASRTTIAATINTIPTIATTTAGSRCGTGTVVLGATASAGTINWYSVSTGGSTGGTGTSYTTPSISSTTTYYVDATTAGCTSASRTAIVATVNAVPSISSSTGDSRCGSGAVTLTATPSSGNIDWYAAATGGSSLNTANSYSPTISATTTYYAEAIDGGCSSARTAVTGTVTPIPTITSTTGASLCTTGTANLSATSSAGSVKWYDAASSGTLVNTGTSFTTPSLSATTYYYVEAVDGSCTSASRTTITVTYGSLSVSISGSRTDYDLVSLTASGGTTYSWDGGNSTNTAANTFDESGTYSVTVSDGSGCTNTQSVSVTVKIRGLNRYGELVDIKNNQISRFGEMGSNNPILKSGQYKNYSKNKIITGNLKLHLDASNSSSYSGTGTTWTDISSTGMSATLTNGPVFSTNNGGYFTFDGTNDYVSLPTAYPGSNDITIEAWVYPTAFGGFKVISNMNSWSTGDVHFQFDGNALQFALCGQPDKYSTYAFNTNTWYHIAAVYDKSAATIKFYVNGTLINTESYGSPPSISANTFKIGSWNGNDRFFLGNISMIRMYSSSLSDNQILNNYNNGKQNFGL